MAPGIEVAQIDNGRYAVSARGFNGRFANKLLVLGGRPQHLPPDVLRRNVGTRPHLARRSSSASKSFAAPAR